MGDKLIMKKYMIILSLFALVFSAEVSIKSSDAMEYVGQYQEVCGEVVSTHYAYGARGTPTFLNFDEAYPNHIFTAVIWGDNRSQFKFKPEKYFDGKEVCVEGKIGTFKDKPQIIVRNSEQINVVKKKKSNKSNAIFNKK